MGIIEGVNEKRAPVGKVAKFAFQVVIIVALTSYLALNKFTNNENEISVTEVSCLLADSVEIVEHERIQYILHDEEYKNHSARVLSDAIKIDTTVFDDTTDFSKMGYFHEYLEKTFPLVYDFAQIHRIDDYGLVYEFEGKGEMRKPIVFLAHQDTVPTGSASDWERDPWSGDYDGEFVYGRGAADCKNLLVGLLEAVELLLQDGKSSFDRRFFLSFGFDEEIGGQRGAKNIAAYLVDYLGENSVEFVIDEGPSMFNEVDGDYYGFIQTGEKGMTDLHVQLTTPGGHSSIPKDHTSIGMISFFLSNYENDLYPAQFVEQTPWKGCLNCMAAHGNLDKKFKSLIERSSTDAKAREELLKYLSTMPDWKYAIRTSQAIDIIEGGDKANALPRKVSATINHRIAYGDSVETVKSKAKEFAKATANKFGLGLSLFGVDIISETENGLLNITTSINTIDPIPALPPAGQAWDFLSGSIRSFYEQEVFPDKFKEVDKSLIVSPMMDPGGTDVRHYTKLSPNLYRSQPCSMSIMDTNLHDRNELISIASHLEVVAFYYNFISTACQ